MNSTVTRASSGRRASVSSFSLTEFSKKGSFSSSRNGANSPSGFGDTMVTLSPDEFVQKLKEVDPDKRYPLPVHIMWAWSQFDKDGSGRGSSNDLSRMLKKFNQHVKTTGHITQLIKECDSNQDQDLETAEIRLLLELCGGRDVTLEDAQFVRGRLESIANSAAHGGYCKTMTSDPDFVSKVIFEWWWVEKKNREKIPPYEPMGRGGNFRQQNSFSERRKSTTDIPWRGQQSFSGRRNFTEFSQSELDRVENTAGVCRDHFIPEAGSSKIATSSARDFGFAVPNLLGGVGNQIKGALGAIEKIFDPIGSHSPIATPCVSCDE